MRLIAFADYNSHTAFLFVKFNTLRVFDIYKLQLLIFMFKLKNNLLPKACMHYHVINPTSNYNTRLTYFFTVQSFRRDIRKKSIAIAGPLFWNALSLHLQNVVCFSAFKRELKAELVKTNLDIHSD